MRERFDRLVLAVLLSIPFYYAFVTFLKQGLTVRSLIYVAVAAGIALTLMIIRGEGVWPALILGGLALSFAPPIVVLHRIEAGMVLMAIIGVVYGVRSAMVRGPAGRVFAAVDVWCMLASVIIAILRFLKDRPGSVDVGAVGGAGEASVYVLGGLGYFLAAFVFAGDWEVHKNTSLTMKIVIVATIIEIGVIAYRNDAFVLFFGAIFSRQLWLLLPLTMAWSIERTSAKAGRIVFFSRLSSVLAAITLLLGVSTPFRSRPFFAVGIILGVAARFRRMRQAAAVLAVVGVMGLAVLLAVGTEWLTPRTARSLSTIMHVDDSRVFTFAKQYGTSSELGWSSQFREEMWRLAVHRIEAHPWFGKGFAVSRADIGFALTGYYSFERATYSLALTGGYHNSVLALAVFAGIPCAAAFALAALLGGWRFYRMCRRSPLAESRVLQAAVLGFFLPSVGQMLMNGMASHFYVVAVLMGVMRGMCVRDKRLRDALNAETAATVAENRDPVLDPVV